MPIIVDGVTMQDCGGVSCDATDMKIVNTDGTRVYTENCNVPGEKIFYESGTWIVPTGTTTITLCMIGGGGSGGICEDIDSSTSAGGGYSGSIYDNILAVTPGTDIPIVCGAGGSGRTGVGNGYAGQQSKFGYITADGGAGGNNTTGSGATYAGNGASRTLCFGTANDGISNSGGGSVYYGGQAGFGNGGNGGGATGLHGGGGGSAYQTNTSGAGGRGVVKITW